MKLSLGPCIACSLVLNLVGFGPVMGFLMNRPAASHTPPPRTRVELHLTASKQPPPPPTPRMESRPQPVTPRPQPKAAPQIAAVEKPPAPPPEVPKTLSLPESNVPKSSYVPSARPRGGATPRTLARPDANANQGQNHTNTGPAQPPGDPNGGGPIEPEATPASDAASPAASPTPEPPPEPGPLASQPLPPTPPPASPSPEPAPASAIPDKAAVPRSNPPNSNSRVVLRRLGGKSFIRLQLKIYPDGHIDAQVLVSSGMPELDQAVLTDLRDWRWEPAEVAGRPVLSEKAIKLKLEAD